MVQQPGSHCESILAPTQAFYSILTDNIVWMAGSIADVALLRISVVDFLIFHHKSKGPYLLHISNGY